MVVGLPQNFQSISPVISSYDWIDISSGCGYRRYYGCRNTNSTTGYFLSTKILDGGNNFWYTGTTNPAGAEVKVLDLDFDIEMKVPAVVSGTAYFNITSAEMTVNNKTHQIIVKVYHVTTTGTETLLGTGTGTTYTLGAAPPYYIRNCLTAALTTKHFAIGEKLRLTVEGWASETTFRIYHDPSSYITFDDGSGKHFNSDMIFDCPFKVNL
jgi:hypothetical protein